MELILLERIAKLGQMGDVVRVKDGFARNFLLPRGKALRATAENRTRFEIDEDRPRSTVADAEDRSLRSGRQARRQELYGFASSLEFGQMFGSVSPRDLVTLIGEAGFRLNRSQIALNTPIKTIGQHKVPIALHPEIDTSVNIIVARNSDEAERIARGEDVTHLREPTDQEAAVIAAEAFFEPGAGEAAPAEDAEEAAEAPPTKS